MCFYLSIVQALVFHRSAYPRYSAGPRSVLEKLVLLSRMGAIQAVSLSTMDGVKGPAWGVGALLRTLIVPISWWFG